jgi:hypothetical protein
MTEQEWLTATDPKPMLEFLRRKGQMQVLTELTINYQNNLIEKHLNCNQDSNEL